MSCAPNASTPASPIRLTELSRVRERLRLALGRNRSRILPRVVQPAVCTCRVAPSACDARLCESSGMIVNLQHRERLNSLEDHWANRRLEPTGTLCTGQNVIVEDTSLRWGYLSC